MKAHLFVLAAALAALPATPATAVEPADAPIDQPEPWVADYEGTEIDLRDGWDGARACNTDGVTTECWDSEAEMLLALAADGLSLTPPATPPANGFRRQYTCPTFLRLYSNTNYSGAVLAIATRYVVLNLSSYGFDNNVSSYRVGACSSAMWDGSTGGAPAYPGNLAAGASAPSMLAGWNNRISSVFQG